MKKESHKTRYYLLMLSNCLIVVMPNLILFFTSDWRVMRGLVDRYGGDIILSILVPWMATILFFYCFVNIIGAILIYRPIGALFNGSGGIDQAARRLSILPGLSAAWICGVSTVFAGVAFISTVVWFPLGSAALVAYYIGNLLFAYPVLDSFYTYFVISNYGMGLKMYFFHRYGYTFSATGAKMRNLLMAVYVLVFFCPMALIVATYIMARKYPVTIIYFDIETAVLVYGAFAFLIYIFAMFFVTKRLTLQVDRLMGSIRRINSGDLEARTPVIVDDEIGALTVQFNGMTASLRELVSINEELAAAQRIQRSIIPAAVPAIGGCTIAARYIPSAHVGGDLYDFHVLGDDAAGILVADVSGHGLPASLIASMVKIASSFLRDGAGAPDSFIASMNGVLHGSIGEQFVTAGYAVIDTGVMRLRYACAGHLPLFHYVAAAGKIAEYKPRGRAFGLSIDSTAGFIEAPIGPGDRIIIYTDCILECINPAGEEFGSERFKSIIEQYIGATAESFIERTIQILEGWYGTARPFEDDFTLIVADIGRPV